MSRGRSIVRFMGNVVLALVVFVALGETLARLFDVVDRVSPLPRGLFVAGGEPGLGYVLRPGADVRQRDVAVHVNALGLRGPEVSQTPAPGVTRVLAVGDSVTFGHELPVEQAFPALLERLLNDRSPGPWQVLNGGVQGYDTAAEAAWLETRGLALAPEIVVVAFNLNDYDPAPVLGARGVLTTLPQPRTARWSLADVSELYFLLRWLVTTGGRPPLGGLSVDASRAGTAPWHPFDRTVSDARKRYYHDPPDARWHRMVDSLQRIRDLTDASGIRLLVAIPPDGDQVDVPEPDLEPQRRVGRLCATLTIECLDLYPEFAAASWGEGSLFFDIMHPNAAGHAVIARRLAQYLSPG